MTVTTELAPLEFQGRWDDPTDFLQAMYYGSPDAPDPDAIPPMCVAWDSMAEDLFCAADAPFLVTGAPNGGAFVFTSGNVPDVIRLTTWGDHMPAAVAQGAPAWSWACPHRGSLSDEDVQVALWTLLDD